MSDELVEIVYLVKHRAKVLDVTGYKQVTFSPNGFVPKSHAERYLKFQLTIGGCCGKPSRTVHVFATPEQLASGERSWIE